MIAFFKRAVVAAALAAGLSTAAAAQEDESRRRFGGDLFAAGSEPRIAERGLEDVFVAGETVSIDAEVGESVHAAGRRVRVRAPIGRDLYGAGSEVEVNAPVGGDVTALGDRIDIGAGGSVGSDLLVAGRRIEVAGPVEGNATLLGQTVVIAAPISGSVQIRASNIRFAPGGRIDGTLIYWSPNPVEVPAEVIAPERVTGQLVERRVAERPSRAERAAKAVGGFIVLLILAAAFAALLSAPLGRAKAHASAQTGLTLLLGLLACSALFGSILVLAASIIGIPLAVVGIFLIPLVLLAGYFTAAYLIGAWAIEAVRPRAGNERLAAVFAVVAGLVILGLVRLIPVVGWVVLVLAVAFGLGAWTMLIWRRRPAKAPPSADQAAAPSDSPS